MTEKFNRVATEAEALVQSYEHSEDEGLRHGIQVLGSQLGLLAEHCRDADQILKNFTASLAVRIQALETENDRLRQSIKSLESKSGYGS